MKKTHIILLVLLAVAFAAIVSSINESSSYATFAEAQQHSNKTYHVVGKYNKEKGFEYDPEVNANLFSFYLVDEDGNESKVIYNGTKPQDFEKSEQVVIVGKSQHDYFTARKILMKCPSKYNDNTTEITTFEAEV